MTGDSSTKVKTGIVKRLVNKKDELIVVICTTVLSMGIDMAGKPR